jgi:hypothetical protein
MVRDQQNRSCVIVAETRPVSEHQGGYRRLENQPHHSINQHSSHNNDISQKKQPFRPQDTYPTPPPSPDLAEEEVALVPPLDSSKTNKVTASESETFRRENTLAQTLPYQTQRTTPAIPISLLLNTPHTLPHGAPFKLLQPTGILSVLGGNRILHVEGAGRILDRMPYSPASTNGVILTRDQAEEDNVEGMLGGESSAAPMSPDQSYVDNVRVRVELTTSRVSSIFVHPPTPDREEHLGDNLAGLPARSISRDASPRNSPGASPNGSPRIGISRSVSSGMPVPIHVLPEVRSPPRRALEMATDSLRIAQNRGRRPKLFGFTELPDSSDSAASSRNASPERNSMTISQSEDSPSTHLGPATGSPGNFLPRRSPIRARSETSLTTLSSIIHSAPYTPSTLSNSTSGSPPAVVPSNNRPILRSRRDTGLKLDFTGIIPLNSTTSTGPLTSVPSPYSARLIRKKSGEILKPALKYGGPLAANGTPLEAPPKPDAQAKPARFASKSAPTTPSCPKYVHFDAQLERVKLFQKEQRPSVVSRNGSPTGDYTTSEGEEYPFPSTDEEGDRRDRKELQIKLPNFPTSQPSDSELFLESLFLDDDRKSLRGVVQVKNISFQKWVAVRFTLDWWQTTSEVTATHKDSVRSGAYDRFSFVIKLHDLLPKIEEKTLFLAIRYNTDGREIWDSNEGHNYQVLFEKVKPAPLRLMPKKNSLTIQPGMGKAIGGRTSQWSVTGGDDDDRLADLRARLDRLQADDHGLSPPQVSPSSARHNSFSPQRRSLTLGGPSSGSPRRAVSALDTRADNDLPAAGPALAARYDFNSALKVARRNSNSPNKDNVELPEVRTGLLKYGSNLPAERGRPTMDFYSPRTEFAGGQPSGTAGFFSPPVIAKSLSSSSTASSSTTASSVTVTPSIDHSITRPVDHSITRAPVDHSITRKPVDHSITQAPVDHSITPKHVVVPDLLVQGPSPEPSPNTEDPNGTVTISPPNLESSHGSGTDDTPSESPRSPPEATLARWSPTSDKVGTQESMTNYVTFIEK